MMNRPALTTLITIVLLCATSVDAQFRRGVFSESTEITLYPVEAPAMLLPPGTVQVEARNASSASARILERLQDRMARQLGDNDKRLRVVGRDGGVVLVATLTEWNESRHNSTKYVSETRQVGTREVIKDGKKKTEPVYEYGRNRPSVKISATAGGRLEVRAAGGKAMADESARHTIQEEYLLDAGPPSRDEIEDQLIDRIVQKGAGRVSPGRQPVRVLLARSDEVDGLNSLAQNRRWEEWLKALKSLPSHRDRKRDSYRLHNLAVAHEAVAYEADDNEDQRTQIGIASTLIAEAVTVNAKEKYITEAADRIARSAQDYRRLGELYQAMRVLPPQRAAPAPAPAATPPAIEGPTTSKSPTKPMSNQDVIELRTAGLDDENLIAAITAAKDVKFDLSPAGLKKLLAAKVSNKVIGAMRSRKASG